MCTRTCIYTYIRVHVYLHLAIVCSDNSHVVLQTVTDFRTQYIRRYNGTTDEAEEDDDDNLVVRSFTDDPDIPLQQIMVRTCTVSVYMYVYTCTCPVTQLIAHIMRVYSIEGLTTITSTIQPSTHHQQPTMTTCTCTYVHMYMYLHTNIHVRI